MWFNTFINGKLILFDVVDNGGEKLNEALLRKILCNYVAALHRQTRCQPARDIWSHLLSTQTMLWAFKCVAFEGLTKSDQRCRLLKVLETLGAIFASFWVLDFLNEYVSTSIHFIPTALSQSVPFVLLYDEKM